MNGMAGINGMSWEIGQDDWDNWMIGMSGRLKLLL